VNLIPFNEWPGSTFRRPPLPRILAFQRTLLDAGLTATIRWSKGEDVGAACGQLHAARPRILDNPGEPALTVGSAGPNS
jgi:23S rRNA (adenine2503-C2)-methyltransferase